LLQKLVAQKFHFCPNIMVFIGPTNQFVNVVTDAANGNVVRIVVAVDVVSVTFYLTRFSAAAAAFSVALKV
jgi:hypothetical protein